MSWIYTETGEGFALYFVSTFSDKIFVREFSTLSDLATYCHEYDISPDQG